MDRIKAIIEGHSKRNLRGKKRPNKRPEEAVVKAIQAELSSLNCIWERYESKYIRQGGYFRQAGLKPGTPDLMAQDPDGLRMAIEVKAPGKRSSLRGEQREFLVLVIKHNGFAICADSPEYLRKHYETWKDLKPSEERQNYLLTLLPKGRAARTRQASQPPF